MATTRRRFVGFGLAAGVTAALTAVLPPTPQHATRAALEEAAQPPPAPAQPPPAPRRSAPILTADDVVRAWLEIGEALPADENARVRLFVSSRAWANLARLDQFIIADLRPLLDSTSLDSTSRYVGNIFGVYVYWAPHIVHEWDAAWQLDGEVAEHPIKLIPTGWS